MKRILPIAFILILAISLWGPAASGQADGGEGPSIDVPPPSISVSSGDSGGGHRSPDIDNFIRQVESWKNNYPERFDYLKKLLYKEPFTTQKYVAPAVWVYYPPSNNTTVSRNEEFKIGAVLLNQNPIEIRRVVYLDLEVQEPGEKEFKPARAATQIIQVNEYDERTNATTRIFPDLSSFNYLKKVGDVKFRIKVSDGQYDYYSSIQSDSPQKGCYGELKMKVYNIPPQINNTTMMVSPYQARWDDLIQYTASMENLGLAKSAAHSADEDQSIIPVTLHILKNDTEISSITKPFLAGDPIVFSTKDKSIFNETDAGKNFSYRYSCSDGVIGGENTTWTKILEGPHLRPNAKIRVSDLTIKPEDDNYYWWQEYNFGLRMKSQNQEGETVMVTLYTDTPAHPKRYVLSKPVFVSGANYTDVTFANMEPFDVADCSQPFRYYFEYSIPDQDGKFQSNIISGPKAINTKLIKYDAISGLGMVNIAAILLIALIISMYVERRFYR